MVVPSHIAIIMDGNGRWAKSNGLERAAGHVEGVKAVRRVVEAARKIQVRYLTLYSFSTENWKRPKEEIDALMSLFCLHLESEVDLMMETGVRLRVIGDTSKLPSKVQDSLQKSLEITKSNSSLDLVLAMNYGGRAEIINACREIAKKFKQGQISLEEIEEKQFNDLLWTSDIPDPDLLIRTSGEYRISNFLLWQLAYTEMVILDKYWPEFDESDLKSCIDVYNSRSRRFGDIL